MDFNLQSRYYAYFQTHTLRKGMNTFIPPHSNRLNNTIRNAMKIRNEDYTNMLCSVLDKPLKIPTKQHL